MKKTANFRILLDALSFFAVLLLGACGDDVTKVRYETSDNTNMSLVAFDWEKDRVLCDSSKQGTFMYFDGESADSAGMVSAYVCVDSVWVPLQKFPSSAAGVDSASCKAQELSDGSGYKVVCAGDSAGLLLNGKNGSDGIACTVSELSDGSGYKIVCGEDSVGVVQNGAKGTTVNQCSVLDDGEGTITQICGTDTTLIIKGRCGDRAYDPVKSFCYEDSVYSCDGNAYDPSEAKCENGRITGAFVDSRDQNVYRYVKIGKQIWMAENLNYETPKPPEAFQILYEEDSVSFCYDNDPENCKVYGRLYTWDAVLADTLCRSHACSGDQKKQGICPDGWHFPTRDEWKKLFQFVADSLYGGSLDSVEYALKATSGWGELAGTPGNGSDAFGFGALPGGHHEKVGDEFHDLRQAAYFWTFSDIASDSLYSAKSLSAWNVSMFSKKISENFVYATSKNYGYSVRCVKN